MANDSSALVSSVMKAMTVLDCFTPEHSSLSLSQISSQVQQPKSTVLNLIRSLEAGGYLIRNPSTQTYSLGYKILEHAFCIRSSLSVVQSSIPFLEDIQVQTGMIVYLVTHNNGKVLYLEGLYPSRRIPLYSTTGRTHPMHCTSCGKAMLAYMDESRVRAILDKWGMEARTPNTITDPDLLFQDLAEIRASGYAVDNEEESSGVRCVAAAIRNRSGFPTAAISISGAATELTQPLIEEYAKSLIKTCNLLSERAGAFPGSREEYL